MKCRKNVRKLIEAFNAAADPSNTELARSAMQSSR